MVSYILTWFGTSLLFSKYANEIFFLALPFLLHTEMFLYPVAIFLITYIISLFGFHISANVLKLYFGNWIINIKKNCIVKKNQNEKKGLMKNKDINILVVQLVQLNNINLVKKNSYIRTIFLSLTN